MKTLIYALIFWPAFFVAWVAQCFKLGYEAGHDSFYRWCIEKVEK